MVDLIPTTILGRTGLQVTRLGIGGAYATTPEPYRQALDCGVNYVDTARVYLDGKNEAVIGEALEGRRQGLVLASKSAARDAAGARAELEISLRDLRTDYLDIWQMHYVNYRRDLQAILAPGGAMEAAYKAREQGLVRFIGITGHDWPVLHEALKTGLFDTVLCWYNCAMREPEGMVFPPAAQHNTGVVLMSVARAGQLYVRPGTPNAPDDTDFYRYVLSHPTVNVALMGLRDIVRFRRTAEGLRQRMTLGEAEKDSLEAYGADLRAQNRLELPF
jgi:aryl-alcohol dehydrogenase-like predicted oxidoreductase